MKLNLVADYDVMGKRCIAAFSIPQCQNLVALQELTALSFPTTDGNFIYIKPISLSMYESRRKSEEVCEALKSAYKAAGRYYDYTPIDLYEYKKYMKEVA